MQNRAQKEASEIGFKMSEMRQRTLELRNHEKWLADHRDEQQPNGALPDIIPTCGWGYWNPAANGNGLDWTSTIALIPWELYLFYGDAKSGVFPSWKKDSNLCRRLADAVEETGAEVCLGGHWEPMSGRELVFSLRMA